MVAATWGFIGTIIGAIVGASACIFTTIINSRNAANLQLKAEKYKLNERFREFQRENLLKLQNDLSNSIRLIGMAYIEDLNNYNENNTWCTILRSNKLDEDIRISFLDLSILIERVNNDDLREYLRYIKKQMSKCLHAQTKGEAERLIKKTGDDFTQVMTKLGYELRNIYKGI